MYVIAVDFHVIPQHADDFRRAMLINARSATDKEPGCRQFDVTVDENDPAHFFLYEVYDDEAAFQVHMTMDHFHAVGAAIEPWVKEKVVRTFFRIDKKLA